jgi:hypothetical protein
MWQDVRAKAAARDPDFDTSSDCCAPLSPAIATPGSHGRICRSRHADEALDQVQAGSQPVTGSRVLNSWDGRGDLLSLADELLLIGLDDELGVVRPDERLDVTLAGAWIAELILLERVDEPDFKLRVVDSTPTGHRDLDFVLQWLADPHRRSLGAWLDIVADAQPRAKVRAGLLDRGLIVKRPGPVPGLARYPAAERETEAALRARLRQAVELASKADKRDACLCRLVEAAELGTSLWGIDRETMRTRVEVLPDCFVAREITQIYDRRTRKALLGMVLAFVGISNN